MHALYSTFCGLSIKVWIVTVFRRFNRCLWFICFLSSIMVNMIYIDKWSWCGYYRWHQCITVKISYIYKIMCYICMPCQSTYVNCILCSLNKTVLTEKMMKRCSKQLSTCFFYQRHTTGNGMDNGQQKKAPWDTFVTALRLKQNADNMTSSFSDHSIRHKTMNCTNVRSPM